MILIRSKLLITASAMLLCFALACAPLSPSEENSAAHALSTSHLFLNVTDTDATIRFWVEGLGAKLESDDELASEALDATMGREGVRIRHTFIALGGTRLHTIEPLNVEPQPKPAMDEVGIRGVSFLVPNLDRAHAEARAKSLAPTPIYDFKTSSPPVRMFFILAPDGIRVEMIEFNPPA